MPWCWAARAEGVAGEEDGEIGAGVEVGHSVSGGWFYETGFDGAVFGEESFADDVGENLVGEGPIEGVHISVSGGADGPAADGFGDGVLGGRNFARQF